MGVAGKKRSREQSLSRAGAEHSRDAGSNPAEAHRSPKAGNAARQDAAGSKQLKQQRGAHASGSPLHARAGKTPNKESHQRASAKASQQQQSPPQKALNGGQAAAVLSTANATLQASALADVAQPPRKKRNKNKFKPDPEPDVAPIAPQHATADFPSRGILPVASHHHTIAVDRPPQEPAAAGTRKKKWKHKNKPKQNSSDAIPAPAQPLKGPGAEQATLTPSNASQAAANGKHHRQGVRTGKKALDTLSQGHPAAPAQVEVHGAGANPKRLQNKQKAHLEPSDARQSGPPESKPQRKRQMVHEHEQKSNGHQAASALQRAAPSAAGNKETPGNAAAAKRAVQTVTAPPLPGVQSSSLSDAAALPDARHD